MLERRTNQHFYVYPSWASYSYSWEDLPRLMSSPLESGYIDPRFDPSRFRFLPSIQPYRLIDGPCGNGVIAVDCPVSERWLPGLILCKEADLISASGAYTIIDNVFYLDPRANPLARIPFIPRSMKQCQKSFRCPTSIEHVKMGPGELYWLAEFHRSRKSVLDVDRVAGLAVELGYSNGQVVDVPPFEDFGYPYQVRHGQREYACFKLTSRECSAGFHYALLVYVAFYLKSLMKSLQGMSLFAAIEGGPNSRHLWNRK